ncbi:NIPSNAP family protein [Candidimonas humi]|uniref:NIPSNAP family protein n=1 Tax=Candidimonas humi TaxID=683355 RepID=A0ABV8P3P4_9BURK|nr:NIPSNAP family protein [Candidimonas humi]MBV6306895.1 NIPSNAP family protein [Candidimonas humi]
MIFEHRTYTVAHGQMESYLARYEQFALPLQMQHLGRLLGFFVSEIGPLNQVLHIWVYDDMADRERRRAALDADPAWHEFKRINRGTFVAQEVKIMRAAPFCPQHV